MILDYSQAAARRPGPLRWLRALWSHQARLELGYVASCKQAFYVVVVISVLAGVLSTTHACLRCLIAHVAGPQALSIVTLKHALFSSWMGCCTNALKVAPVCFCVLLGSLILLSNAWARRGGHWTRAFPVFSLGSVPLLWFFVLFQIEGIAGLFPGGSVWHTAWNPVTNYVRFIGLMIGFVLLAMWMADALRLYGSLRERDTAPLPRTINATV
jgi:hypothetical protein